MSMSIPPILIGRPVAFFPVPRPQTDLEADALPAPTGVAVRAPVAQPARVSAKTQTAPTTPTVILVDLIDPSRWVSSFVLNEPRGGRRARLPIRVSSSAPSSIRRVTHGAAAPRSSRTAPTP